MPFTEKQKEDYTKWAVALLCGISLGLITYFKYYAEEGRPTPGELPVFLAPIFTFIVACLTFMDYVQSKKAKIGVNETLINFTCIGGFAGTALVCFCLSDFHSWRPHMFFMILLFTIFSIWDWVMLNIICNDEKRSELKTGVRLVNRPTLFALVIILAFLIFKFPDPAPTQHISNIVQNSENVIETLKPTQKSEAISNNEDRTYKSDQDAFVAGLISFHLIFSAIGYLATTFCGDNDFQNGFMRGFCSLLSKVPRGPN